MPTTAVSMSFGAFQLFPQQRLLMQGDRAVRLGSRALDILLLLITHAGEVVSKEALVSHVWPDTHVVDDNLAVHVSALRRALGDGRGANGIIITEPGRGYRFVAELVRARDGAQIAGSARPPHNLPILLTRLVGQEGIAATIRNQLAARRLITLTGPGGIGKTSLALAIAEQVLQDYEDGVWFVDLAPVAGPGDIAGAVAAVLGIEARGATQMARLVGTLRTWRCLIVLDNCEQVIEEAAALVQAVLRAAPGISLLTTSREPLRLEGEQIFRLTPLAVPPRAGGLTAVQALEFAAVDLFVERIGEHIAGFALTDDDASITADICRQLDGIPLAIELAAPQVGIFGLTGLHLRLRDDFRVIEAGRRGGHQHQQTLLRTLEWSYRLLSDTERTVLRRLSVFAASFSMAEAIALGTGGAVSACHVIDAIAALVCKSLLTTETDGDAMSYRLLETTRAFAVEKLVASGEFPAIASRAGQKEAVLF